MPAPDPYPLTSLELASGVPLGAEPGVSRPPARAHELAPLAALEEVVLPALQRPPCLVSFSGGRDSSAILAVAASVARREGLQPPVPATTRFPSVSSSDELEWQERVVEHLGLREWVRLRFEDELDLVGPVATTILRRHGVLFPVNLHLHAPLLEAARGGSLLTGVGGDEVFGGGRTRIAAVLTASVRPQPRDLLRVGLSLSPRVVRRKVFRRRLTVPPLPWLTEEARSQLADGWAADDARYPTFSGAGLREWWRSRYLHLYLRAKQLLARDDDVQLGDPFATPRFVSALAAFAGRSGFGSRTEAMQAIFSEHLPEAVTERPTKASFDAAFWNAHSRAFAVSLIDGALEPTLERLGAARYVETDVLRDLWRRPETPPANTFLLLQACWWATAAAPQTQHFSYFSGPAGR